LLHPHENQPKLLGYQITLVYSKRVSVRNNLLHSVSQLFGRHNAQLILTRFLTQKRKKKC
jgi:hypothetical protein